MFFRYELGFLYGNYYELNVLRIPSCECVMPGCLLAAAVMVLVCPDAVVLTLFLAVVSPWFWRSSRLRFCCGSGVYSGCGFAVVLAFILAAVCSACARLPLQQHTCTHTSFLCALCLRSPAHICSSTHTHTQHLSPARVLARLHSSTHALPNP